MGDVLVRREPVVNRHKAITASRLIVHARSSRGAADALNQLSEIWPRARNVFVSLAGTSPDIELLNWKPPENAMIEIPAGSLERPGTERLMERLKASHVPVCLDGYEPEMLLPAEANFRFALADAGAHPYLNNAPCLMVAKGLPDHPAFDEAIENGYDGAAGWFFLHGMPIQEKLNPSHAQIVRVLNLVRHNAEVKEIDEAFKQDVTLSYKLLRYINSAGFGLSCEIQSFKHAVTILGYEKLNKWLSLLLVTASKDPAAPALMQTAIARGRFMETVGKSYFDKSQLDNLFITGAFSLLEALLGARLEAALEQMLLPEPITDALLNGEGIYAPFLDLAMACEGEDVSGIVAKAGMLQLDIDALNHAQIEALNFADSMQFN